MNGSNSSNSRRTFLAASAAGLAAAATPWARAQTQGFPGGPVTIVVASAPGGPLDAAARLVAQHLSMVWSVPVVIDARGGAGGTIAAALVARAPGDGQTLLMSTRGVVINPALYAKLPFDTATDLAPVAMVNDQPNILVVPRSFPAQTMPALLKLVRENPGKYSFGSPGAGGIPHLAGELFMRATGTQLIHVPYKGAAPMMNDVLAGRIDMTFGSPATVMPQLKDGSIVAVAVASPRRSPLVPDIPTFAELGVKDMNITSWYGLFAPGKTPEALVQKINADLMPFLRSPETVRRMQAMGSSPTPLSVEEFRAEVRGDLASFSRLIRDIGLKLE